MSWDAEASRERMVAAEDRLRRAEAALLSNAGRTASHGSGFRPHDEISGSLDDWLSERFDPPPLPPNDPPPWNLWDDPDYSTYDPFDNDRDYGYHRAPSFFDKVREFKKTTKGRFLLGVGGVALSAAAFLFNPIGSAEENPQNGGAAAETTVPERESVTENSGLSQEQTQRLEQLQQSVLAEAPLYTLTSESILYRQMDFNEDPVFRASTINIYDSDVLRDNVGEYSITESGTGGLVEIDGRLMIVSINHVTSELDSQEHPYFTDLNPMVYLPGVGHMAIDPSLIKVEDMAPNSPISRYENRTTDDPVSYIGLSPDQEELLRLEIANGTIEPLRLVEETPLEGEEYVVNNPETGLSLGLVAYDQTVSESLTPDIMGQYWFDVVSVDGLDIGQLTGAQIEEFGAGLCQGFSGSPIVGPGNSVPGSLSAISVAYEEAVGDNGETRACGIYAYVSPV